MRLTERKRNSDGTGVAKQNLIKDNGCFTRFTDEILTKHAEYEDLEEAKIVADKMTYADAVCNVLASRCVPYRKATNIKLKELLEISKSVDEAKNKGCDEISTTLYYDGFNDGYSKALDGLLNSLPDCDYVGIECLVCLVEQLKRGGEK